MVVLLVSMSIAAIMMSAAMPVWHQSVQRERESELIFRGNQYVRAISLFQRRAGPGVLPPNLDVLITSRYLRKKYKDPITGQDFDLLSPMQQASGPGAPGGAAGGGTQAGRGVAPPGPATTGAVVSGSAQAGAGGRGVVAGIMGVASKSKDASIRIYNGRTHYNEWQFLFVQTTNPAGSAGPGGAGRGGVVPGQGPGAAPPIGIGGRGIPPALPGRGGRGAFGAGNPAAQGGRGITVPASPTPQPAPGPATQPATPASPFAPRR
jgi:type II secretory pathway pseudopilin PulG